MYDMKIKKNIKGEEYTFYFEFIVNECKAKVRYFHSDEWVVCEISKDLNYIVLPEQKFIFNNTNITKLKLNKFQKNDLFDYNPNLKIDYKHCT